jgi:tRNA U34 2-thiouridine synthase MnmA/TrmU
MTNQVTALGLFSGGLDSILACRVVADLGVRVIALKFVTPFFDHDLLHRPEEYTREMAEKYGIEVALVDLSEGYLEMLDRPAHGFGKHFNAWPPLAPPSSSPARCSASGPCPSAGTPCG